MIDGVVLPDQSNKPTTQYNGYSQPIDLMDMQGPNQLCAIC